MIFSAAGAIYYTGSKQKNSKHIQSVTYELKTVGYDFCNPVLQYMNILGLMKEQDEENERKFHSHEDSWNRIRNTTH